MHKEAEKFISQIRFMIDNLGLKPRGVIESVPDVVAFGDSELIYEYAILVEDYSKTHDLGTGVKDKLIKQLAEGISASHGSKFLYQFEVKFPNFATEKIARRIMKIGNEEYIELFAKLIEMPVEDFKQTFSGEEKEKSEPESA